MHLVKADWAEELCGLQHRPEAIKFALDYPSPKPPKAFEFKEFCNRAPIRPVLALNGPAVDQSVIDRALALAQQIFKPDADPLSGARELRRREESGDKSLTKAQREFWRTALRRELEGKQA